MNQKQLSAQMRSHDLILRTLLATHPHPHVVRRELAQVVSTLDDPEVVNSMHDFMQSIPDV